MNKWLNINSYKDEGFAKVCDVMKHPDNLDNWFYYNVDDQFVDPCPGIDCSYVYFIVRGEEIVKIGETGNSMLIQSQRGYRVDNEGRCTRDNRFPVYAFLSGSKSRLGRYMNGDRTCAYIRDVLDADVRNRNVSIWARRCPTYSYETCIAGCTSKVYYAAHKDFERKYLDKIRWETFRLPEFNKLRK